MSNFCNGIACLFIKKPIISGTIVYAVNAQFNTQSGS